MKLNRKVTRLAASVLATAMFACATALPAMAEDPTFSGNTVTITKTIDMTGAVGAGVPKGTYHFTIAEYDPVSLQNKEFNAKKGISAAVNSGSSDLSVSFDGESSVENIPLTFDPTQFAATGAGLYYYTITENDISNFAGMTKDLTEYFLKIEVANDGDSLVISDAVMYPSTQNGGSQTSGKVTGFTNTYATTSLTVTKDVEGRMGDKKKQFSFEITLNDPNHTTGDHIVSVTSTKGTSDAETVKFNNGQAKVTVTLADTESVTITGLPVGTTYEIVESDNNSYTVEYTGDAIQDNVDKNKATGDVDADGDAVTVVNTITDTPATGVIMNVAPYVLMVGIAVAGCFVFLRKRRDD